MKAWLLIALCCALPAAAAAQTYPSKIITLIVPAPPGGVTDVLARTLAQRFTAAWGQQAIVENRPGGNNQVAAEYVTRMPPDGHTVLIGPEVRFIANPGSGRSRHAPRPSIRHPEVAARPMIVHE
jgi:tripartite-type tricarboxylate transporter receptor subunit TctC